ncbi:unnamed protein product [Leptidea sinapis]|uniref:THAP-type domain-containing protein n=1 Tax=Leptidea sinapis TaxID=189913 RepID=A0A5E4PQC8_9NEOP|nr:unnamed protein product [Leptidea sinapis]
MNFPKEGNIKEKWIDATGRKNWFPTKYSTICSSHFSDEDFSESPKLRKLYPNVYPKIEVWTNDKSTMNLINKNTIGSAIDNNDETEAPKKQGLRMQLTRSRDIINQEKLKIHLEQTNIQATIVPELTSSLNTTADDINDAPMSDDASEYEVVIKSEPIHRYQ